MPSFQRDDVSLHYMERGSGFPILLFAPGGMRSAAGFWKNAPGNPVTELCDRYRVIAMDQRNAGKSTALVRDGDGWHTYTADHLALLDHLGIERCHLIGGCIGGPYCLGVMQAAPGRVASAVLQQPIGSSDNRQAFYEMFDGWAQEIAGHHPEASEETWRAFRSRMYDGDFVFNVDREFVRGCETPMLVLMGDDLYHPQVTSREIARLAPKAELIERWKDADRRFKARIRLEGRQLRPMSSRGVRGDQAPFRAHLYVVRNDLRLFENWEGSVEGRMLHMPDLSERRIGALVAIYRYLGKHFKVGVGYNFTDFSDDLTDLSFDHRGVFVNMIGTL